MLIAVGDWNGCGDDAVACHTALSRIEILTTGFGSLYWDDAQGRQSPVPVPNCFSVANKEVIEATTNFRAGTAAGFRAYDYGEADLMSDVRISIAAGAKHLQVAEVLIHAAHCSSN
jgi:hypothetical protein